MAGCFSIDNKIVWSINHFFIPVSRYVPHHHLVAFLDGLAVDLQLIKAGKPFRQFPITHDWLTVKLIALVVYVLLGIFALRRGQTKSHRFAFYTAALLTYGFMISVALTKHPAGIFS